MWLDATDERYAQKIAGEDLHHEGQWSARLDVSVDKLSQDVKADLVICHRLNDANWQREYERDGHG